MGDLTSSTDLSIIIPVYNTALYIDRCLESIVSQNYTNYEVLLIDDGSTDQSGIICDRWSQEYHYIHSFHKINGGQSSARNVGIEKAKGKYIWFIDSDDYLSPNTLHKVMDFAFKSMSEVLYFSYKIHDTDKLSEKTIGKYHLGEFTGIEINKKQLASYSICTMISLRSIWREHDLRFVEGIIFEDLEISPRLLQFVQKAHFLSQEVTPYIYFLRPNSTTKEKDTSKKLKQIDNFFLVEKSWCQCFNLRSPKKNSYDMVMVKSGTNLLHRGLINFIRRSEFPLKTKIKLYYEMRQKGVFSLFYNNIFRCDISKGNLLRSIFWNTIGRSFVLFSLFSLYEYLKDKLR